MKDIVFRGKHCGVWVYGGLVQCPDLEAVIVANDNIYYVDPGTVGQYVGLRDKNRKRIFEGDIVTGYFNHEKITGKIVYGSDASYYIDRGNLRGIGLNNAGDWLEVIGNVYDERGKKR